MSGVSAVIRVGLPFYLGGIHALRLVVVILGGRRMQVFGYFIPILALPFHELYSVVIREVRKLSILIRRNTPHKICSPSGIHVVGCWARRPRKCRAGARYSVIATPTKGSPERDSAALIAKRRIGDARKLQAEAKKAVILFR